MTKKVQVIVTLSGMFEATLTEQTTAAMLVQQVADRWCIPLEETDQPIVVLAKQRASDKHLLSEDEHLFSVAEESDTVRIVLPLQVKE